MSTAKFQSPSYRLFEVSRILDFVPISVLLEIHYEQKIQSLLIQFFFTLLSFCTWQEAGKVELKPWFIDEEADKIYFEAELSTKQTHHCRRRRRVWIARNPDS